MQWHQGHFLQSHKPMWLKVQQWLSIPCNTMSGIFVGAFPWSSINLWIGTGSRGGVWADLGGVRQPLRSHSKLWPPGFTGLLWRTKGQTSLSLQSVGVLLLPYLKQGLTQAEQTMGKQEPSPRLWRPWQVSMALTSPQCWSPKKNSFQCTCFPYAKNRYILTNVCI